MIPRFYAVLALAGALASAGAAPANASPPIRPAGAAPIADGPSAPVISPDIRVQITATTSTQIGAPMSGRLLRFPFKDGERFKEGQVLARFDCAVADGAVGRARAQLDKKRKVDEIAQKQRSLGTNSAMEYEIAAAEVREAQADLTAAQAVAGRCTLSAPFSGRVASVSAREYQHVNEGAPLLEILDDGQLETELIVPSRWLSWLKPGVRFQVMVDETAKTYGAEIIRISGKVDAVSQSVKVYGRIVPPGSDLLPGMSGQALFQPSTP